MVWNGTGCPKYQSLATKCFVVDGKNLLIIDDDGILLFDPKKHGYKELQKYRLIILEYFDLMKQSLQFVGCFMYGTRKGKNLLDALTDYIRFESINKDIYPWTSLLNQVILATGNAVAPKDRMKYYFHPKSKSITSNRLKEHFVTFQLHYRSNYKEWRDIYRVSKKPGLEKFQWRASEYCKRMKTRTIMMENGTREFGVELQKYYNNNMNEEERKKHKPKLKKMLELCQNLNVISMKINNASYPGLLRQKMRKLLMNEVDLKHIELRQQSGKILPKNKLISEHKNIYCAIVLYNTLSVKSYYVSYNIRIYTPSNGPHPHLEFDSALGIHITNQLDIDMP